MGYHKNLIPLSVNLCKTAAEYEMKKCQNQSGIYLRCPRCCSWYFLPEASAERLMPN